MDLLFLNDVVCVRTELKEKGWRYKKFSDNEASLDFFKMFVLSDCKQGSDMIRFFCKMSVWRLWVPG